MSFVHAKGTEIFAHGRDISGYCKSAKVSGKADTAETTTFGNSSKTHLAGLVDATMALEGFVDGAASGGDSILAALFGIDSKIFSRYPAGDTRGNYGQHMSAAQVSYDITGSIADAVGFSAEAQSSVAAERGQSLKSGSDSVTTSTSETVVDDAASSLNGGAAYLHVLSKASGTTIDVIIEHSDTGVGAWSTVATFAQASAAGVAERVAIVGTIKEFVRASWALGGGGTWKINVALVRK